MMVTREVIRAGSQNKMNYNLIFKKKIMKTKIPLLVGAGCLITFQLFAKEPFRKDKPNVLFIMSDQHNAMALSCYGNSEISTPNLDRIAKNGVRFENAFCTTAQCVPSRYSIWTGRYARSTGTYGNGNGQNASENTVADLFDKAGYVTGTIGKHHMVMNKENQNHGFDVVLNPTDRTTPLNPLPYDEVHPGRSEVGESPLPNEKHTSGMVASASIKFIDENKDHPFVLWCSFQGPHTPIVPSAPWSKQYDPMKLTLPPNHDSVDWKVPGMEDLISKSGKYSKEIYHKETLANYYGMISQIDYNIGLVLDELDRLGLTDNTIIVYTADHGEMMSEHGAWTKGMTGYDATVRVPLIIKYQDKFSGNKTLDELACSIDLLPTLLDLSGLPIPENIQGKSLVPLITNKATWREYAFSELGSSTQTSVITVRGKTEKYVLFRKKGMVEYEQFFDLKNDPWETSNLAANSNWNKNLVKMRSVLKKWEQETETSNPLVNKDKPVEE